MKRHTTLLLAAALAVAASGFEAETAKLVFDSGDEQSPDRIVVTANEMAFNYSDGTSTFNGNVIVTFQDVILSADQITSVVNVDDRTKVEFFRLEGNVSLETGKGLANSNRGMFLVEEKEVELYEDVQIQFEGNLARGNLFLYDIETRIGKMSGRATVEVEQD